MRLIVSGHREHKLVQNGYDMEWIYAEMHRVILDIDINHGIELAYSGMASGVDLEFCEICKVYGIPYIACVPFEGQEDYMTEETKQQRKLLLESSCGINKVKNSWMVEHCDMALVVWDGSKGGTHNVVEQMVGWGKPFHWINPVGKKVWSCV